MVQVPRLELGQGIPPDPKSGASTSSAIPALIMLTHFFCGVHLAGWIVTHCAGERTSDTS